MKHSKRIGRLFLFSRSAVALGIPLLITIVWIFSYLGPFRIGQAVLAHHRVWLTKGYEVECAAGKIQASEALRQYWEGDPEPSLNEFLETGAAPVTGWYREPIIWCSHAGDSPNGSIYERLGIHLFSQDMLPDDRRPTGMIIPCWLLMAVSLAISIPMYAGYFRRRRASQRLLRGCCAKCGYDLRAGGCVCPECGSEIVTAPAERRNCSISPGR